MFTKMKKNRKNLKIVNFEKEKVLEIWWTELSIKFDLDPCSSFRETWVTG